MVTLLVTPDDAEALTLSNAEGHVQLVLRNSADQQVTGTHGRQLRELYGGFPAPDSRAPAVKPSGTPRTAARLPVARAPEPPAACSVGLRKEPAPEVIIMYGNRKPSAGDRNQQ